MENESFEQCEAKCEAEKKSLERTGTKLIIFWFIVGFILGAIIF